MSPAAATVEHHLARAGLGVGQLAHDEDLGAAGPVGEDGAHRAASDLFVDELVDAVSPRTTLAGVVDGAVVGDRVVDVVGVGRVGRAVPALGQRLRPRRPAPRSRSGSASWLAAAKPSRYAVTGAASCSTLWAASG